MLNDYPKRAYNIKQGNYTIKVDYNRDLTLTIPYTMSWNLNYVASFHDAIKIVSDGKPSFWTVEKGFAQLYPGNVIIGSEKYYFNEYVIPLKIIYGMLGDNDPMINLELKDQYNQTQYSKCFMPKMDYHPFDTKYGAKIINIYQHVTENGEVFINIHQNSKLAYIMQNLYTIELSVVPKKLCVQNI